MEPTLKRKRRTNAEILADSLAERANPEKRKRRTQAEIARDKARAARKKKEAELAKLSTVKVVYFLAPNVPALGRTWNYGDSVRLMPGTRFAQLAYDKFGNFVLDKTPEEQLKLWKTVRYEVREEPV